MAKEVFRGELETLLQDGAVLIDVREAEEIMENEGLPGRMHLPLSQLADLAQRISKERPTIFYCRSGLCSFQAAEIAANWTEQPVYYLSGGLIGFVDA